jgi:peptidyl-prolyl cis-trans isomerase D
VLITKFNRMIRNRILWGVFAIIISVSFLGFIGPRTGCRKDQRDLGRLPDSGGRLNGEEVPERSIQMARFFEMGLRESNTPRTPAEAAELRQRSWKRVAALKAAASLGIQVTDDELREVIRNDPSFKENGVFSKQRYTAIVNNQLHGVDMFETYLRESLTLRKLTDLLRTAVWTAPAEVQHRLSNLTDSNVVEFVAFTNDAAKIAVDVSAADAEAYFMAHTNSFIVPEKVSIKYVTFPFTNFIAPAEIADADVRAYYDDRPEDYSTIDTNGVAQQTPFDEVKESIRTKLATMAAADKAHDTATDFAMQFLPDRDEKVADFEQVAAASNLVVHTTALFSARSEIPGMTVGRGFRQAAFRLDASDPDRRTSEAVAGSNLVYVLSANERKEAYLPPFAEVSDAAMAAARSNAQYKAYIKRVTDTRTAIAKAIENGKTLAQAAKGLAVNVVTTAPFTVYETYGSNVFDYADIIVPKLVWLRKGEITEPLQTDDGVVIARLIDRSQGDFAIVESFRPQLVNTLQGYRAGVLYDDWAAYLLSQGQLKDYRPIETGRVDSAASDAQDQEPLSPPRDPNRDNLQNLL